MSQRRSAPAHIAITTSLTDTPKVFLTVLTVSRSTLRNANRRCGVIARLNGVAGARPGRVAITAPSPRFSPSISPISVRTGGARVGRIRTSSLVIRTVCTGRQASRMAALAASTGRDGGLSGWNGSAAGGSRPAGVRSNRTVSNSVPETPSTAAWWILL
jgi:hypothetical protein